MTEMRENVYVKKGVNTMSYNWGPFFLVPSDHLHNLCGKVTLREEFNEELLQKDLKELGFDGVAFKATNPWYYRRKGRETWVKIGESDNRKNWFSVPWDTSTVENGDYEILGLVNVMLKKGDEEHVISRQRIADVTIKN